MICSYVQLCLLLVVFIKLSQLANLRSTWDRIENIKSYNNISKETDDNSCIKTASGQFLPQNKFISIYKLKHANIRVLEWVLPDMSSWHFLSSFCTYPLLLFPFLHELHVSCTSLDQQAELTALWEVSQPNKTFYWWMLKVKAGKAEGTRSKAGSPLEISAGHTKSLRSVWLLMALGMSYSSCQSLALSDRAEGWKALT